MASGDSPVGPLDGAYSDVGYAVFGGTVAAEVRGKDAKPVAGALVKLYGPTLAVASTGATGRVTLGPLVPGADYRIVVEAPGYATYASSTFKVDKKTTVSQRADLKAEGRVTGTVKSAGIPLAGAVVSDGTSTVLTDSQGCYELRGVMPGAVFLTAGKPKMKLSRADVTVLSGQAATSDFSLTAGSAAIYFDTSVASGVPATRLTTFKQQLGAAGWILATTPPAPDGVWVLVSPAADLTAEQLERITTFVAQGGKLVVFGDWGGFGGFRTPAANALVHRFGLHFNPDLVREPGAAKDAAWLTITRFTAGNPAVEGLKTVSLFQACSLFGLAPNVALAQTGTSAYRVQSEPIVASQTVMMGGAYKGGKVVIVGDTTAFTDDDTDGNGTLNAAEGDNARAAERLMAW